MKQFRYKEWLFVEVNGGSTHFEISPAGWLIGYLTCEKLPQGQYSIIGKADELTEEQWRYMLENSPLNTIAEPEELKGKKVITENFKQFGETVLILGRSFKPRTTLVLKLNEAHTGDKINN